ncbi:T9SS sorting signal type C domain-containing protein [Flavobacterium sp.]|uniref:T9SS sorting signal type C domain-containing protein n=1 Tax=Flavobacterium sp. TaxID=239 RepID=UPI0031D5C885
MKKTLLLFLLLPFFGFAQGLSGDYIISKTNTLAKFETLTSAIAKLEQVGFDGPVNFLLDEDQTVTSQYVLKEYANSSETNILTIKPYTDKNITITAKKPNDYTGIATVFLFNGATNIIIDGSNSTANTRNLTLINDDALGYVERSIIWIASNGTKGSNNITIKNSTFKFSNRNAGVNLLSGVYSGNNTIGGNNTISKEANSASNSKITISNNEMINTKEGIYINGNGTATLSPNSWKIKENKIGSSITEQKPIRGMYLSNMLNYEISNNTISGVRNTENQSNDAAAIVLLGTSTGTISSNTIDDIANAVHNNGYLTAGILVKSTGVTNIFNNIISKVYNTTANSDKGNFQNRGHNIFITSGSRTNVYYNTIIGSGAPTGTTRASCLYTTGGSGINVRNNIFINTQSGIQYAFFIAGGTLGTVSHNNYYVTNSSGGFSNRIGGGDDGTEYIGTGATGVTAWNSATSETNSTIINPSFTSDYHLQDVAANNDLQGIAISEVTNDIDGETRVKPYIGADEILKCAPTGDQTAFGSNIWNGYVYKLTTNTMPPNISYPALPSTSIATYIGTVTENKNFDRNIGSGAVTGQTSNFACDAAPSDRFFVRYKMLADITEAGVYSFDIGSDDGVRLYIDDVATPLISRWNGHGYTMDYATQDLAIGQHKFVLEYYEDGGDSRVSFFFGIPKGNPSEYGDKVWNVYGYVNNDITLANVRYAGYYVDPNLNPDSTNYWPKDKSPSAATIWQGSQIPDNNFTVVYKRKGFDCGLYQLKHMNHDDAIELYIDDKLIFSNYGWDNATYLINSGDLYPLNSESRVEIRLREDGGDANLGINFTKTDIIYNGTGTIPDGSSLVINKDTALESDLKVCSCTINPDITLTVKKDVTLTVDENIKVETGGKLLILDGGSLLQTSTSKDMFSGSMQAFEIQRITKVRRFDLTYWSPPVNNPDFKMNTLSPETYFDKYLYWSSDFKWATNLYGTLPMEVGKGYSIRGPQSFNNESASDFTGKFFGKPNNGDIVIQTTADKYYFTGNPYPSAIDARKFIKANGDVGPLYFWTHASLPKKENGSNTATYSSPDYAIFTSLGGTRATTGGEMPSGYIGVGQGFFVKPKVTSIIFNNDLRVKAQNTQFFKTTAKETETEVNRLWLNLSNNEDAFKQLLIGYAEGATNTFDYNYDAVTLAANSYVDFYTINEAKKLAIQARALPFDNTEIIPLGYKATVETSLTISIDHADGFFDQQAVYLEDKTTGIVTDLRASNYTFTTLVGTFPDRFVLRYTNKTLGTDDFENVADGVLVAVKSKVVNVTSGTENIKEVQIYTIGGQMLYNKNKIEAKELQIPNLHSSNQVLLVKVILENGNETKKKIIFN